MFTGIIEGIGSISSVSERSGDRRMLIVAAAGYLDGIGLGDSIAVNGICLTAAELIPQGFAADVSSETLGATTARSWTAGLRVNLERALTPSKPLGGHMVSGHVDGTGKLLSRHDDARSIRMNFEAAPGLSRYVAQKGSICINGISLTVNEVRGNTFGVNIIPHTARETTLGELQAGDVVNLEVDLIARYLERLLSAREES